MFNITETFKDKSPDLILLIIEYIKRLSFLYEESKKEEYLLDAFREDIVYGLDKGEMLLND